MAAAKKAPAKPAVRKPRAKKIVDDGIYWVVSKREFLTWEPAFVHKTALAAAVQAARLEDDSMGVLQKYKVSRVTMVD